MRILMLAKRIDRTKFDFAVCAIESSRSAIRLEIEQAGCPVYDLDLSRKLHTGLNAVRIIAGFYHLFKRLEPDVVQTQALHTNLCARLAAILAGVPIIVSTENSLRTIERRLSHKIVNWPLYFFSDLLDTWSQCVCVVSEFTRRQKDPKNKSSKVVVLPPFFDSEAYLRCKERGLRKPFADANNPAMGVLARLSPEKGHACLISAMPEILKYAPGTKLFVIGTGPYEPRLRREVESLGIARSVRFVGYRRDVFCALSGLDALFVPSLSEALGLVALEAMAMALPVVATRVGGIPEIVRHMETGILVEPGDVSALANAMKYLLAHPAEAREIGRRAKDCVFAEFQPESFVKRQEELYESLATKHLVR